MYQKKWIKCDECEIKKFHSDTINHKTNILSQKEYNFCCESCKNIFISRIKDDIINFTIKNNDKFNTNVDVEKYINEIDLLKNENEELLEQSKNYYEGYVDGVFDSLKNGNICPFCEIRVIQSIHHIIPRKHNGLDIPENLIALCLKCHDKVELLTEILLKRDNRYDTHQLRSYILNNNFPVEVDK